MLAKRLASAMVLIPIAVSSIALGGWYFTTVILIVLSIAGWEYWRMFSQNGYDPSLPIILGGIILSVLLRHFYGFAGGEMLLGVCALAAMLWHTIQYERGKDTAALDFGITLAGVMYIGWLGSYLISLEDLPNGNWWLMVVLFAIILADTAAFFFGRRLGRHKMSHRVSPNKSWEGYLSGIISSALITTGFCALIAMQVPSITPIKGLIISLVLAIFAPAGDFGESMIKRQLGFKDSSNLIPGHGGFLDRIDSYLWAGIIGYYLIQFIH